jgi:hypothetical protein
MVMTKNIIHFSGAFVCLLLFVITTNLSAQDTLAIKKVDSLQEVIVEAKKQLIEINKGKIVLNIQNSTLTSGASALDMLKKLPGVSLGQDDDITLRGTSGVNIMIDGKMTYLSGKQLSVMLQGLSAENISRMELLTSPSAEFDAAGNAGIINIITKRKNTVGYAVDLRSGISKGRYWMVNENITASINTNKFSVFGSFDYNRPRKVFTGKSGNTISENGQNLWLSRDNENTTKINYYTYRLGLDWKITTKHTITLDYNAYLDDFKMYKYSDLEKMNPDQTVNSRIRSNTEIIEPYYYDAGNVSYKYDINSTGKRITADAHYISYRNLSDGVMNTEVLDADGGNTGILYSLRFHQPGFIRIKSIKTDVELPVSFAFIKAGIKYAVVSNDNAYRFDSLESGNYVEAESMSNHFKYDESIAAAYFSLSKKINKIVVDAGLRVENTYAKGYTVKEGFNNVWSYTRLFPSLSIERSINNDNKINFSVSRRIERPSYGDLNPVRWYNDQYFYYSGNPDLVPEMAWLLSSAYTFKSKYILTATYAIRNNYMTRQLVVDPVSNAIKSQSTNFENVKRIDLEISAPLDITSFWNIQITSGINYTTYPIFKTTGFENVSQLAGNIQLQQQVKLPFDIQLEISSFFRSNELLGIYKKGKFFYADAGLRKSFFNKNMIVQLSCSDYLYTNRYIGTSLTDITDYRYNDRFDSRRVGLTVRYHIGGKLINKKGSRIEEQERL